jgi:hypothetical protein
MILGTGIGNSISERRVLQIRNSLDYGRLNINAF